MKIKFRHTRVFTFLLTLLLLCGVANQAWAAGYKVRYHILTLPFDVPNNNGSNPKWRDDIRVEALLVVVSNASTIELPAQYKSPLATNFQYYSSWTSSYDYLYDYTNNNRLLQVKYNLYSKDGGTGLISEGTAVGADTDIYVTYDYQSANGIVLDGSQDYNIGVGTKYLCYNRSRNNRLANANSAAITGEHLASQDFVMPEAGTGATQLGFNWSNDKWSGPHGVHMGFWFTGYKNEGKIVKDPYNITIMTAYTGNETYEKDPVDGDNKTYVKPYKGATLFSKMISQNDGNGTEDKMWFDCDDHVHYKGVPGSAGIDDPTSDNYWEKQVDHWPGFYRQKQQPVFNSVAILNRPGGGYVFVASKLNQGVQGVNNGLYKEWAPNKDGNYPTLTDANLNPKMAFKALDKSPVINIYKIRTYTFKIKTHVSKDILPEDMRWSDAKASSKIVDLIPETLKRKYCTYKAYADAELTNEISTFEDAITHASEEGGKKVIWLKYETNMPFETSATSATYDNLKWYNFYTNKEEQYIVRYNSTSTSFNTTGSDGSRYARTSHFAFVGDPYELKIVSRKLADDNSGTLRYLKLNDPVTGNITQDATGTAWDIVYDDNTGTHADCFRLREYTTTNNSTNYLGWAYGTSNYPLKGVTTEDAATRLKVIPVPTKTYVYHIMRSGHSIAAKASVSQDASTKLDFAHIPEIIRSPFLALTGVTLKFYDTESKAQTNADDNDITYAPDDETSDSQEFWVRYDMGTALDNTPGSYIKGETAFNVRLNGQYIYYDNGTIKTTPESAFNDDCATNSAYQWRLGGSDPYAMTVLNVGANKYVTVDYAPLIAACQAGEPKPDGEITWSDTPSKFIIKGTSRPHIYEVMAALGEDVDSRSNYFNIGCPSENTVKLYGNESYVYNSATLRFELTPTTGTENLMYHLIDKAGKDLLQMPARQVSTGKPEIPEYWSPLVKQYHYYKKEDFTVVDNVYTLNESPAELEQVTNATDADADGVKDIFVTYTANDLVDMQGRTTYLMKYVQGENFRQEDGVDDLLPEVADMSQNTYRYKAVYPYCNGDCNFFVYGQEQYDIQQQGAASTRTRWAWYVESVNNDPYHVKIFSRQQETYPAGSGNDYNAYFRTYAETYGGSKHVVTTLAWPGISGVQGTEYMVLGSAGQFRLVTTEAINDDITNERRTVNSFEQYWKTWNTIRKIVLNDKDATAKQSDPNTVPATPALPVATAKGKNNRTYLTDVMGWHSYEQWAYAIRWNDYNKDGDKNKKGWENLEHWYQTVNMGEGYFDFEKTTIEPVLILLDQHGWEIMRKPLPSDPNDPEKYAKYDAIRPYDSPMVKEYAFWKTAKKRTGFHQYYLLSDRIGGEDFTSTSLTDLPPYDSENVKDAKGNLLDQYVTYIVKDEYAQTYDPSSKTGQPFLIEQGSHFVKNDNNAIATENVPTPGGMSQYIISNISNLTTNGSKNNELWYVKPNADIDIEMGYQDATKFPTGYAHEWDSKTPNAYEDSKYNSFKAAVYVKETPEYKNASADDKKKLTDKYGEFSFSNGFDPYNIQISSVSNVEKLFVTNATTAHVNEGSIFGDGTSNTLGAQAAKGTTLVGGWDNRTLQMTNATFMAVQDKNGNMQLMPRFDQEKRLKDFSALVHTDDAEETKTHTKLYRPLVYNYHIIDNSGHEALRYQGGGDLVPQTPAWFKSPLAKDYKYYKNLTKDGDVYTEVKNKTDISAKEITESLEGAAPTGYDVYVRYSYDESADNMGILKGKWLTMDVDEKDAQYTTVSGTAGIYSGTKPETVDGSAKEWQWKFLANSQTDPDPYAVSLYNRNTAAGTATPVNSKSKFALLNWYNGVVDASAFTLAVHGTGTSGYDFVNGHGDGTYTMSESNAATTATEANVKSTSCSYNSTDAKIELIDDVSHTYTYKVYTNDDPVTPTHGGKYGVLAISANQDNMTIAENDYVPILPEEIRSPLLNIDQFKYYGAEADMGNPEKELKNIFGLYEDNIYVRYTDYDLLKTEYQVPNVKTVVDSKVARGESSNDAALDIKGELIYNIIWYDDNMMQSTDNSAITGLASQPLQGGDAYIWQFEGNDPYAIKIKHKKADKYVKQDTGDADGDSNTNECMLANEATTFMLLPSTDAWQYGVLQVTGDSDGKKLTGVGDNLTADAGTGPTKFIIFGLSTHKVIYHLVIANIGGHEDIPYYNTSTSTFEESHAIAGSTMRNLNTTYQLGSTITIGESGVNYCVDEGHITLGDPLKVPEALKRPNCKYFYYVGGIYDNEECTTPNESLNNTYKGREITQMGTEPALLGKTVVINVVYAFDDGLPTNNGANFVTDKTGTQWFTTETNDETPYLARITSEGTIQSAEGREPHYTNEFLWKPIGDPYGFKMYNRYIYKNAGQTDHVMTTTESPADGQSLKLGDGTSDDKAIYELFAGETDGYFIMRPMLNNNVAIYNNAGTMTLSSTNATEWTFGLSETLFKPYRDRAGYVGGLNDTGKTAYDEAAGNLQTIQGIVYNDANIVSFAPGYYRLHNLPNTDGITTPRYMSGYLHEIEKTYVSGGIPMHFYSRKGVNNNTFESLESGYTVSPATQGQIPIPATEYDPSSIFYITGSASEAKMHTQGLNVIGNKMGTATGTSFHIVDIGGACVVIYDGSKYLSYNGTNKYDIGYDDMSAAVAERSKWCLEPANNMGLYIKTNSGGEEETLTNLWYYSSYCVPFDLLIADKDGADKDHSSNAYTCVSTKSPWPTTEAAARVGLHPKPIGKYNTGTYKDNDYFVPAGTPVLFSTKRAKDYIKATIPATSPSTSISTIFSYQYLEQKLPDWNYANRVYVFGPKMEGTLDINTSSGIVNATLPSLGNTNVGFHLNANPNKEAGLTPASWMRNNRYVLHNKIYYREPASSSSPAPQQKGPEFVPVIFDDDEEQQELNPDGTMESVGDGCIYDLMGRKVATREQVEDGSWKQRVATGIYILNGKKFQKK